ncbi:MAG: hypothetical protein MUC63_01925 [Planctomycetes bacterium]|nr:hypothetical protein [Planctomycetota bacterium]
MSASPSRSRTAGIVLLPVLALVFVPAPAAAESSGFRAVPVEVSVPRTPERTLPEAVRAIGVLSLDPAKGCADKVLPGPAELLRTLVLERMLGLFPGVKVYDRMRLPELLKEGVREIPAVDAILTGSLEALQVVPAGDGSRIEARVVAELRLIDARGGKIIHSLAFSRTAPGPAEAVEPAASPLLRKAIAEIVDAFAAPFEKTAKVRAVLVQTGPLTEAAVRAAQGGDLNAAKANLEAATRSDAERNAGHFDLYVLLSLAGDAAGAEEHLKKAGE